MEGTGLQASPWAGLMAPRAPELLPGGQWSVQYAAHTLGQAQGAGEGSNMSCTCVLHVKLSLAGVSGYHSLKESMPFPPTLQPGHREHRMLRQPWLTQVGTKPLAGAGRR